MNDDMKRVFLSCLTALLLLALCLGLSACGLFQRTSEPTAAPSGAAPGSDAAQAEILSEPSPTPIPTPTPTPTPTPDSKPDIDINSFEFLLANSYNSIGMEYRPEYSNFEGQGIDARIYDAAMAFLTAARDAGFECWISVAFRNSEFLNTWYLSYYNHVYNRNAVETANHFLAQGIDEHQTGLAIDFTDQLYRNALYEIWDDPEMADTELYRWLVDHCTDYGFILRYPEGKEAFYGVACRHPAHFRYVGVEAAKYITEHDLCLEEFLLMYEGNNVILPKP